VDTSELAPAPAVDEDPIATIVIGLPFLSFVAMWDSGLVKRIIEKGASQLGTTLSACTANGKVTAAMKAPTANDSQ
jgi:hypothetical protein